MAEYVTSIEIEATPAEVFDYLVTEAGMTAWMGQHATLDPRTGGGFAVDIAGYAIRGRYLEVDRPHRVVVSWGVAGSPDLPPGTSTVEFTLTPTAQGTRVTLMHSSLPDTELDGHADGWTHFLARLRIVAAGGDAGHDDWVPIEVGTERIPPAMTDHAPLADRIRAALMEEPSTREVPMFGGLSFMVNEKMVVAVHSDGDLLVRVAPDRNGEVLTLPGARPAEMGAGRVMGPGWIRVAEEALATDDELSFWTNLALEYNAQAGKGSR